MSNATNDRLLRAKEVMERVGLSATTIWRLEKKGDFPARRGISKFNIGWLESEIERWLKKLPVVKIGTKNGRVRGFNKR